MSDLFEIGIERDITGYPVFAVKGLSRAIDNAELQRLARLMAAAPKMLDELKHWVAICPNCGGSGERMHSYDKCLVPCEKCAPSRTAIALITA